MSPTPVTMSDPTAPASYAWEATSEQVAARYGLPVESIVRFDLNTSPAPPELAATVLAAGRFETGLSEYPPSDYRRLTAAAAARYGVAKEDILVNAVAPSIMDTPANRESMPKANYDLWPKVEEVAATILFLASPENRVTRGAVVPVYGKS